MRPSQLVARLGDAFRGLTIPARVMVTIVLAFLVTGILNSLIGPADSESIPVARIETRAHEGKAEVSAISINEKWPLLVQRGTLRCEMPGAVTFSTEGKTYALNGTARGYAAKRGWNDVAEIWKPSAEYPGTKENIGPLVDLGLSLCK